MVLHSSDKISVALYLKPAGQTIRHTDKAYKGFKNSDCALQFYFTFCAFEKLHTGCRAGTRSGIQCLLLGTVGLGGGGVGVEQAAFVPLWEP